MYFLLNLMLKLMLFQKKTLMLNFCYMDINRLLNLGPLDNLLNIMFVILLCSLLIDKNNTLFLVLIETLYLMAMSLLTFFSFEILSCVDDLWDCLTFLIIFCEKAYILTIIYNRVIIYNCKVGFNVKYILRRLFAIIYFELIVVIFYITTEIKQATYYYANNKHELFIILLITVIIPLFLYVEKKEGFLNVKFFASIINILLTEFYVFCKSIPFFAKIYDFITAAKKFFRKKIFNNF